MSTTPDFKLLPRLQLPACYRLSGHALVRGRLRQNLEFSTPSPVELTQQCRDFLWATGRVTTGRVTLVRHDGFGHNLTIGSWVAGPDADSGWTWVPKQEEAE